MGQALLIVLTRLGLQAVELALSLNSTLFACGVRSAALVLYMYSGKRMHKQDN